MKTAETGWTALEASRKRLYVQDKYSPARLGGCAAGDIKNVLVIQAASRSGSSFLYRLLSGHPDIISLNGEDIVFHKLAGMGTVKSAGDSDSLPRAFNPAPAVLERVATDILLDSGSIYSGEGPFPQNYAADCVQRLLLQWPGLAADPDELYRCACEAIEFERRRGPGFDSQLAWAFFLTLLGRRGVKVNPWYYDLGPELLRRSFAPFEPPSGPPLHGGLEETPFVVPEPRVFPGAAGARQKTLLLKSSSNCYRGGFIKKLFPAARFRFVLLSRNPMAAMNGLMDGWLSRSFFSRDLGGVAALAIKGYSSPAKPWTCRWWKFDLPPGWARYCAKTLAEVCAFQWASANRSILADSASGLLGKTLRVRYEDLLAAAPLERELRRISDFAGLPADGAAAGRAAAPVMAVTPPRPHKWLSRKDELLPFCASRGLRAVASELGYDLNRAEELP